MFHDTHVMVRGAQCRRQLMDRIRLLGCRRLCRKRLESAIDPGGSRQEDGRSRDPDNGWGLCCGV